MKIECIFEPRDIELLKNEIPLNPCDYCTMGSGCCGCPQHYKYTEVTEEYKERGILKYAQMLKRISIRREQIEKIQKQIEDTIEELPQQIRFIGG